jgi:hypothetical protein
MTEEGEGARSVGVITGLWRWRRNPLRRTTDLVEAWVAVCALLLVVLGAPLAGWLCGTAADSSLRDTVRAQHRQRHVVSAVVVSTRGDGAGTALDPESALPRDRDSRVVAVWHTADGSAHRGTVSGPRPGMRAGDSFTMWTDQRGTQVRPPLDATVADVHAGVVGAVSATVAALLALCARRLIVWRLVRRRHRRLDQDWAHVGPDWGRTGTGS